MPSGLARVWALDESQKVLENDISNNLATSSSNITWSNGTISLAAAKGEVTAFQLVLQGHATALVESVDVTLDSLVLEGGGYTIKNVSTDPMAFNGREIDIYVVGKSYRRTGRSTPGQAYWSTGGYNYPYPIMVTQMHNYPPLYYGSTTGYYDTRTFNGLIPKYAYAEGGGEI